MRASKDLSATLLGVWLICISRRYLMLRYMRARRYSVLSSFSNFFRREGRFMSRHFNCYCLEGETEIQSVSCLSLTGEATNQLFAHKSNLLIFPCSVVLKRTKIAIL